MKKLMLDKEITPVVCEVCGTTNAPDSLKCDECGYDIGLGDVFWNIVEVRIRIRRLEWMKDVLHRGK